MEINLIPTELVVKDTDGTVLFKADAVYLDLLLGECQNGRGDVAAWLPVFTETLNKSHNVELTPTQAYVIATTATKVIQELKKNIGSSPMYVTSTSSTPSPSVKNNSTDCGATSADSPPSENVASDQSTPD